MTYILSITITALLIFIIICIAYIVYLKYFKKHTRERFAFFAASGLMALVSSYILQVYSSQGYISSIINTSNFFLNLRIEPYKTDIKDHIIVGFLIIYLIRSILKMHKNWNGPISEIHYEKERFSESNTLFQEWHLQFNDFISKKKKIIPHVGFDKSKQFSIFTSHEEDRNPWHISVFELFTFNSYQYRIDLDKDYYHDEKTFISKYGQDDKYVAILCSYDTPSLITIKKFVQFVEKQKKTFSKLIVAIKKDLKDKSIKEFFGYSLEFRYEQELLNNLIDFHPYFEYIKYQYLKKEITDGARIPLNDFYVELNANTDNKEINEISNYIKDWINEKKDNKHLAILGEYGCGKSVLSLKITFDLLFTIAHSRIPILIELRGKSPRNLSMLEIISNWASNYRIEPQALLKLHRAGKLLLIFEGFDEMDMVGDREVRLNHFQRLWEFAIPNSKIIITGRPNFFLDDKELKMNLGIEKPFDNSHYCEAIYLKKLNKDQIKHALRNVENNTKNQILDILSNSHNNNFYDLISRPAILYLVAVIWEDRKLSEVKEKINSAYIISEFIKYSYSRQSGKNASFPLTEKEREYFMIG